MTAVPITMNPAAGGNAGGGAIGQAAKASTLPAFAQVMAQKQAEVSSPKNASQETSGVEKENAANDSPEVSTQKSSDSGPVSSKSSASGTADRAKKSDAKGKSSSDAGAGKSAVPTPVQVSAPSAAQIPAIPGGMNGAAPWVAGTPELPAGTPVNETVSTAMTGAAHDESAVVNTGTSDAVADGAMTQQPGPAPGLSNPIAANSKSLPVSELSEPVAPTTAIAEGTVISPPEPEAANGATAKAATPSSEDQMNPQIPVAVPTMATASEPPSSPNASSPPAAVAAQSLPLAGNDPAPQHPVVSAANNTANAIPAAVNEATAEESGPAGATASPAANAERAAANTQTSPKTQGKRSVQEILGGAAAPAGREAQSAAHASVNAVKDAVGVAKGKSGGSGKQTGTETVVGAKNESPVSVKAEAVSPEVTEAPEKHGSAKSGSNIKGNSTSDANVSGNSGGAGSVGENAGSGPAADPNAAHGATSVAQNDPSNFATSAANAAPAPAAIAGKDLANATTAKAGDASNSGAPAVQDADDAAPPPNESRVVNVAQLAGDEGHSQVRIAMQTDQLGQVELHATVRGQQVGAAITVEKKEAHAAMAAEMPSLQQALEERQLRVGEVVLMQGAMHSTAGDAGNAAAEQQRRGQAGTTYQQVENETMYESGMGTIFESSAIFDDSGRLSVRA